MFRPRNWLGFAAGLTPVFAAKISPSFFCLLPSRMALRVLTAALSIALLAIPSARAQSDLDYLNLTLPHIGDHALHVLAPTILEIRRLNSKPADGIVDSWNFVDADFVFSPPATSELLV